MLRSEIGTKEQNTISGTLVMNDRLVTVTCHRLLTQSLASQLASVESARAELEQSLTESKTALETLQADLVIAATDRQTSEHQHQQAMSESQLDLLGGSHDCHMTAVYGGVSTSH